MKWICIKDFPQSLFILDGDVYKAGRIFKKWTYIMYIMSNLKEYDINEYIIELAEWRDKQIDNILND